MIRDELALSPLRRSRMLRMTGLVTLVVVVVPNAVPAAACAVTVETTDWVSFVTLVVMVCDPSGLVTVAVVVPTGVPGGTFVVVLDAICVEVAEFCTAALLPRLMSVVPPSTPVTMILVPGASSL